MLRYYRSLAKNWFNTQPVLSANDYIENMFVRTVTYLNLPGSQEGQGMVEVEVAPTPKGGAVRHSVILLSMPSIKVGTPVQVFLHRQTNTNKIDLLGLSNQI